MDSLSRIKFALFRFPPSVSCLEDMNFILRVVFPTPQAPTIATEYWCGSGSRSQLGSSVLALPLPAELSAMSKIWIMFCRKKKESAVLPWPPPLELSSSTLRLDLSETDILDILLQVLKKAFVVDYKRFALLPIWAVRVNAGHTTSSWIIRVSKVNHLLPLG